MKPDPDMMCQAMFTSSDTLKAIAEFQVSSGIQFGYDASHGAAYNRIKELANALQSAGSRLHNICLEADERNSPKSRMQNETT
jgi:hypothetical protein